MIITKCDRCGKELPDYHDVFFLNAGKNYSKRDEAFKADLCEWCFRCLVDFCKLEETHE